MRYTVAIALALGVSALAACNQSPSEEAADNIEANAENTAEAVREEGDNAADAVEENAAD